MTINGGFTYAYNLNPIALKQEYIKIFVPNLFRHCDTYDGCNVRVCMIDVLRVWDVTFNGPRVIVQRMFTSESPSKGHVLFNDSNCGDVAGI
jgi:hypothetical protein